MTTLMNQRAQAAKTSGLRIRLF